MKPVKKSSRGREGSRKSDEGPYFFKVVYAPVSQGLRIPTGFVEEHEINKRVVLKVRTGHSWPIELRRTDDGYWLDKGWQEFAEFYAIDIHHFLTFRYEGNSQFFVVIFNPSGKEIEEYEPYDDDDDNSLSVKILAEKPESSRRTGKRRKTRPSEEDPSVEIQGQEQEASVEIMSVKSPPTREEQHSGHEKPHNTTRVFDKEKYMSYKRAKTYASEKSDAFICFMQPSYAANSFWMHFPLRFTRDFIPRHKKLTVELHVPGLTEVWPLDCTHGPRFKRVVTTGLGWHRFVLDNKILVGDVCVFEWAPSLILNVKIFRNN